MVSFGHLEDSFAFEGNEKKKSCEYVSEDSLLRTLHFTQTPNCLIYHIPTSKQVPKVKLRSNKLYANII